jgi:hypothetical protein
MLTYIKISNWTTTKLTKRTLILSNEQDTKTFFNETKEYGQRNDLKVLIQVSVVYIPQNPPSWKPLVVTALVILTNIHFVLPPKSSYTTAVFPFAVAVVTLVSVDTRICAVLMDPICVQQYRESNVFTFVLLCGSNHQVDINTYRVFLEVHLIRQEVYITIDWDDQSCIQVLFVDSLILSKTWSWTADSRIPYYSLPLRWCFFTAWIKLTVWWCIGWDPFHPADLQVLVDDHCCSNICC